ncbi:universal stress protein [Streptomyces sp. TRM66268-LWL]|uniref:Universal stress protein n=1 Tax=Streptomyces polyasparticus TaxID=2767826 RepID=A0ABR7SDM3_9ACTN|nr:universal stress protein [Streptomyces polyasparticus]MBC9712959.1 universal stress protein [Streptomyces polyasparticus]
MSTHAPVIAAVDGSEHSLTALAWAMEAARVRDMEVLAVHVRGESAVQPSPEYVPLPPQIVEELDDAVRERVLARAEGAAVPVTYSTVDGVPSRALAEAAAKAQLLVVGSRGLGGFAALLLGSTGRKLAAQAPCPVVIVPHAERTADRTDAADRVVLGLAPDETADAVIDFAFTEAGRRGAELQVVSTYLVPLTSLLVVGEMADSSTGAGDSLAAAQSARLAPFTARHPSVRVAQVATAGDPAGRLVTASRSAALTVVGRHRRRLRPEALMMGSVTNAVLHHAHGPVVVVPGE